MRSNTEDFSFSLSKIVSLHDWNLPLPPADVMSVCKRRGNKKRDYLFVNKMQAKHSACTASSFLSLESLLTLEILKSVESNDSILTISFAETATALGLFAARTLASEGLNVEYTQTTREFKKIKGDEIKVDFKEEHSHASECSLIVKKRTKPVKNVVMIDDEITTGKTAACLAKALESSGVTMKGETHYILASAVNWMNSNRKEDFENNGFSFSCLAKGEILDENAKINLNSIKNPTDLMNEALNLKQIYTPRIEVFSQYSLEKILKQIDGKKSLIIGSEEEMEAAILLASEAGDNAQTQSTTRSPIEASEDNDYLIKSSWKICSAKNKDRAAFLYNVPKHDITAVIATSMNKEFMWCMDKISKQAGAEKILFLQCSDNAYKDLGKEELLWNA